MDDLGKLGPVWREADASATDYETGIHDMLSGQYRDPIGVFAFNAMKGWCRNIFEDFARELRIRCDLQLTEVPSSRSRTSSSAKRYDQQQLTLRLV
jgi:hypothetical protein